jgi:hypothetical protein
MHDIYVKDDFVSEPMEIIVFGGISALSINARDVEGVPGVTGDADYMFPPGIDFTHSLAFQDATKDVQKANPDKFVESDPDKEFYMDSSSDDLWSDSQKRTIAAWSTDIAWQSDLLPGKDKPMLVIKNGPWGLQLMNKMDRMEISINRPQVKEYKARDLTDAKEFFKRAVAANGNRKIDMNLLNAWADAIKTTDFPPPNMDEIVRIVVPMLQEEFDGFADDVIKASKDAQAAKGDC